MTEIFYDPDVKNPVIQNDVEFVKDFYDLSEFSDDDIRRLSPWVLRIVLNSTIFFDKKMRMSEIVEVIGNE
jgi:DNA-directed RNA polymerase II subunit RPB1